jgi:integrase
MDKREIVGKEMRQKNNTVTFTQYANSWYQAEYSQIVSLAKLKITQIYLDNHIEEFFGDLPLSQITETDIIKFFEQKKSEGYSVVKIRSIFIVLSTLFEIALKKGLLEQNPMEGMKIMNEVPKKSLLTLSEKEIIRLLEVANLEGEGLMYEFILHTGVRLGEFLALRWSDIDMDKETVTINSGKLDSRRLTLLPQLVSKLKEHKVKQQLIKEQVGKEYKDQLNLVFPKKNGDYQSQSTVRLKFRRLTEKAGLRRITFHDLRRTYINLLFLKGVSPDILNAVRTSCVGAGLKYYYKRRSSGRDQIDLAGKEIDDIG